MNRDEMWTRARDRQVGWDVLVIGGGATGLGIAVDAASRGYSTLLLERSDFGKGTSSRSTKLVHGGVRYLQQGNLPLVFEGLRERELLRNNAPHLVHALPFLAPAYRWWESPFYGFGLKVYSTLARNTSFPPSRMLSRESTLRQLPALKREGLRGGVLYYDGQFDDARLVINLAQTAAEQGATVLNYTEVTSLTRDSSGHVTGVHARELENGAEFTASAKCIINATGPFCDGVRRLIDRDVEPLVATSQGIHLVFDRSFLGSETALMVPRTTDGRVLFAIPWHGHAVIGTTDTPIPAATEEPAALEDEIDFVLENAGRYLQRAPVRADILSVFTGIRPLVRAGQNAATAALSRDHLIHVDASGLITITGGKWTTYRRMAEDCVTKAAALAGLPARPCVTTTLHIHGHPAGDTPSGPLAVYGSDAAGVLELASDKTNLGERLHPALPYTAAEAVWAARFEMARTVEDVLARRTRALFLNARAALAIAPAVGALLAAELGWDSVRLRAEQTAFERAAANYLPR